MSKKTILGASLLMTVGTVVGVVCLLTAGAGRVAAQDAGGGKILEQIVARVNNEAITTGDLQKAQAQLEAEAKDECKGCTPEQINEKVAESQKDLLRDLIDESLLTQRAKDLGISVETDVVKRLDEIRIQNNIATMEELEKKISETGTDFEDYKNDMTNQLLRQEVIRREVGSKIIPDQTEIQKYYEDHKQEFVRPEQVMLRQIFINTDGKSAAEVAAQKARAQMLLQRVKDGEDFGELAKRFSDDANTARQNGQLGTFSRGQLAPVIEDAVFKLKRNETTDVLEVKGGFLILQVLENYPAGLQPEANVDSEITEKIYQQKLAPAYRDYLKTLRRDSFVDVKAGYVDSAAVPSAGIEEVASADDDKSKGKKK